jgi:hypothetical protein
MLRLVIPNVTKGGVKDLLYLTFNIGALTVFTIGFSGGNALDAVFPLRKAAQNGCPPLTIIVKTVPPLNSMRELTQ